MRAHLESKKNLHIDESKLAKDPDILKIIRFCTKYAHTDRPKIQEVIEEFRKLTIYQ